MTDRWQQVDKICQVELKIEESQRAAYLDAACRGDEELHKEAAVIKKKLIRSQS